MRAELVEFSYTYSNYDAGRGSHQKKAHSRAILVHEAQDFSPTHLIVSTNREVCVVGVNSDGEASITTDDPRSVGYLEGVAKQAGKTAGAISLTSGRRVAVPFPEGGEYEVIEELSFRDAFLEKAIQMPEMRREVEEICTDLEKAIKRTSS